MTDETASSDSRSTEEAAVRQNRYLEALDAGLDHDQADEFSTNGIDIGQLRKLVSAGVEPSTIADIVV